MIRESDTTSSSSSPPYSDSRRLPKERKTLKWSGFATFCLIQLLLGGWSTILFLLTVVNKPEQNSSLVNCSILLALCGLVYLVISIYNSFLYGKRAGKFTMLDGKPLKRSTSKKIIRTVFISSLIGVCVAFLGSTLIAGEIFSKLLAPQSLRLVPRCENMAYITFPDIFISQSCINIIAAHCVGIVNSLWTLNQIEKSSVDNVPLTIND